MEQDNKDASKILLYACLFFIAGIFYIAIFQKLYWFLLLVLLLLALVAIIFFKQEKKFVIVCFCFFIIGALRTSSAERIVGANPLEKLYEREIVITAQITEEPEQRERTQKLVATIKKAFGQQVSTDTKVLVYLSLYPQYHYADKVQLSGELEEPPLLDDFDYKQYLARRGVYGIMFYPEIELIKSKNYETFSSWLMGKTLDFKQKLRASLYKGFTYNQQHLLGAMILGDKTIMPDNLKQNLNKAGIRHLSAISGMHITIIAGILMLVFLGLGLWRQQAIILSIFCIFVFIILTGAQPSAIRAGIFSSLYFLGQILGRLSDSIRVILLGAVIMLAINPLYLNEIGFQLSFLAVMGINYLYPILSFWLKRISNKGKVRSILAMTLSAQIFTLPVLIYNFGYVSLVAPLTNILVLPVLPFVIALGFLSALLGIVSQYLALIFIFPTQILLSYIIQISEFFAGFRFSAIHLRISWVFIIIFYIFLAYFIRNHRKKHSFRLINPWGFWDEIE